MPEAAEEIAWVRRTLAQSLLLSNEYEQCQKALALVEPIVRAWEQRVWRIRQDGSLKT